MTNYTIKAEDLLKSFSRRLIFKNLSFEFSNSGVYGISGSNGSGKSTLVKIIANIISPTKGKVLHFNSGSAINKEALHNYIGLVSPYLVLYDEFSAEENIEHFSKIRGIKLDKEKSDYLFDIFNLSSRKEDLVKAYSSGMKQRLKFIFAMVHSPSLLILDEPVSNLDNEGKETVYKLIEDTSKNAVVLVASNEDNDLSLCQKIINLSDYKDK